MSPTLNGAYIYGGGRLSELEYHYNAYSMVFVWTTVSDTNKTINIGRWSVMEVVDLWKWSVMEVFTVDTLEHRTQWPNCRTQASHMELQEFES